MPMQTLISAKEFARTGPDTDGFELVRGELVEMPPPKRNHGATCNRVAFLLNIYLQSLGRGTVFINDTGLLTQENPDTVRGVDVMLYLNPNWTPRFDETEEYTSDPPDLAVEVRSPDQSWKQLLEKVAEYLNLGVPLVWVVDPKSERVHVFRPDQEPEVLAADNVLEGGAILPGFHCKAADLFVA